MDKNKRVMKKVLAATLSLSLFGTAIVEKENVGLAIWPFGKSYTQEEIDSAHKKALGLIDEGLELVKELNDLDTAQSYVREFQDLKYEIDDGEITYDKAVNLQKEIKRLNGELKASINLQEVERRKEEEERVRKIEEQKLQAELEEKQKEEEHRRRLEEQRLQMEKEERERQEAIKNAIVSLEERLDSVMRDVNKKVDASENAEQLNVRAAEIREKIQQIDNLNRVEGIEALFEEFQTEITAVLEKEEKIRQEKLESSLKETKEEILRNRENLQNLLSELDEENENYAELWDSMIVGYNIELINNIDNLEGAEAVKKDFEEATAKLKVLLEQQAQREAEKKAREELDRKIENLRDPEKQTELLSEGKVSLDDVIGGNQKAKNKASALLKSFERYNKGGKVVPSKGLLFYGPPGTGKTSLVKAFAAEKGSELFLITPSAVMGDNGERKVSETFVQAKKAAQISGKPVIILLDEIDAIAQKRSSTGSNKVLVMTMNEMDELIPRDNVVVMATTNRKEALDPAITRSGRLDQSVEVGYPNAEDKKKILDIYLRFFALNGDINIDLIADKMKGFSGADIKRAVDIAIESAMERENVETFSGITIKNEDLQKGIATIMDEKTSVY